MTAVRQVSGCIRTDFGTCAVAARGFLLCGDHRVILCPRADILAHVELDRAVATSITRDRKQAGLHDIITIGCMETCSEREGASCQNLTCRN